MRACDKRQEREEVAHVHFGLELDSQDVVHDGRPSYRISLSRAAAAHTAYLRTGGLRAGNGSALNRMATSVRWLPHRLQI